MFIGVDGMLFADSHEVILMKSYLYFKSGEAEALKQTYVSWIGRDAHTGKGKKQVLKNIIITECTLHKPFKGETSYKVEFIFEDNSVLNAYDFLVFNSLITINQETNNANKRNETAA